MAGIPLWRHQPHEHDALKSDVQKTGKQYAALHWPDRAAALQNDCLRGLLLCVFYSIDDPDRRASDCGHGLRTNQQNRVCGKGCFVSVPVCGDGDVFAGAVWHGAALVCLDGAQAEKAVAGGADAGAGVRNWRDGISRRQGGISPQ